MSTPNNTSGNQKTGAKPASGAKPAQAGAKPAGKPGDAKAQASHRPM
jgi:hypothetical protein